MITPNSSFLGLKIIDLSSSEEVAAAGNDLQLLTPPKGQMYKIKDIYYLSADPAGSSSGNQYIDIGLVGFSDRNYIIVISNFGSAIFIKNSGLVGDTEVPSSGTIVNELIRSGQMVCSNSIPMEFYYKNATDVSKTGTRTLEILVEIYKEVL